VQHSPLARTGRFNRSARSRGLSGTSPTRLSRRDSPSRASWRAGCRAVLVDIEPIRPAILENRRPSRSTPRVPRSSARMFK
jgi:hypothetical protein